MVLSEAEVIRALYRNSGENYNAFTRKMEILITELLSSSGIRVHEINSRVKDIDSIIEKCIRKNKYNTLNEITDIVGVRVITLIESEIDKVAQMIEKEFTVDRYNTIDRRIAHDPERFGYLSLHYVVSLKRKRINLSEFSRFDDMRFEIQVRSILQHAWAEIEHDLGYKSKVEVPKDIRRRFSQVAGLLEIADRQFNEMITDLKNYKLFVEEKFDTSPASFEFDNISIIEIIKSDYVHQNEEHIARSANIKLNKTEGNISLSTMYDSKFNNADEFLKFYAEYRDKIVAFALYDFELDASDGYQISSLALGFTIKYACYIKMALDGKSLTDYMKSKRQNAYPNDEIHEVFDKNTIFALEHVLSQ